MPEPRAAERLWERGDFDPRWFHEDEFDTQLPLEVSREVARFYGMGRVGRDFAQGLASFLAASAYSELVRREFVGVRAVPAADSARWARWPWQRCRGVFARWNTARRCDLKKNHGGVHISEQGMDVMTWHEGEKR